MVKKGNKLYNTDNIEFLRTLEDNSISSCISDVPYGLQDIDGLKLIKENANNTRGFMNKAWDCLPTVDFLKECNRVLKDGAFFITTFSPRQDLQCVFSYRLLEAGFDINFTPILWCFASGFPKASDYSKMADRRAKAEREVVGKGITGNARTEDGWSGEQKHIDITKPTTPEAQYLDGLKSVQLKPAYEVVIIAQKPYKAKSKIDQALVWYNERKDLLDKGIKEEDLYLYTKNASGGVRIDKNDMFDGAMSSRIPVESGEKNGFRPNSANKQYEPTGSFGGGKITEQHSQGRFPATILVEDNCLDVGRETKSSDAIRKNNQSKTTGYKNGAVAYGKYNDCITFGHNDQGDLSRYFSLDAWTKENLPELYKVSKKALELQKDAEKISPFLFTSKADKGSKNAGLESGNTHCTAKSLSLYSYLINLFTFPHDLVLDPYCGSGTTPIACVLTNRHYIGLELEKEYFDIAQARVKYWQEQKEYQKSKTSKQQGSLL
jgi:DNA modification methylase